MILNFMEEDKIIIKIGDKFDSIVAVANTCFAKNYKAWMRGAFKINPNMKPIAWFPKLADISNGRPQPGDKWHGWCNTISSDGKFIYMNNFENPQELEKEEPDPEELHLTFAKYPHDKQYTFVGVFIRTRRDAELGWVCERVAEEADTSQYL